VSFGPKEITLGVVGRRVPVVGELRRIDNGEIVCVPINKNARSGDDRDLLNDVAEFVGLRATKLREGRPRGGLIERAVRKVEGLIANGYSEGDALEAVRAELGWGELRRGESRLNREDRRKAGLRALRREVYRTRAAHRDQLRDQ